MSNITQTVTNSKPKSRANSALSKCLNAVSNVYITGIWEFRDEVNKIIKRPRVSPYCITD